MGRAAPTAVVLIGDSVPAGLPQRDFGQIEADVPAAVAGDAMAARALFFDFLSAHGADVRVSAGEPPGPGAVRTDPVVFPLAVAVYLWVGMIWIILSISKDEHRNMPYLMFRPERSIGRSNR
jgi:hypothetical protein